MNWSVSYAYLSGMPAMLEGDDNSVMAQLQAMAARRHLGSLEFDNYGDEIHAFFRRNGRRQRFANLQYEV